MATTVGSRESSAFLKGATCGRAQARSGGGSRAAASAVPEGQEAAREGHVWCLACSQRRACALHSAVTTDVCAFRAPVDVLRGVHTAMCACMHACSMVC